LLIWGSLGVGVVLVLGMAVFYFARFKENINIDLQAGDNSVACFL